MITKAIVLIYALVSAMFILFGKNKLWKQAVAFLVSLATVWLMVQRDTYLPFLGAAVFPSTAIINDRVPDGWDTETTISFPAKVANGTKIIYWGAEPTNPDRIIDNPWDAYKDYTNVGVASIQKGMATIKFKCPAQYKVAMGQKTLDRHIHYRICCVKNAMMGPVETVNVVCAIKKV